MFTLTNINAMNAAQAVTRSHADVQTSMERLSTGSRINAARDDAAGLAMSQRMAAQIISIGKTIDNASDAVGLMNTADGALEEVSRLLQRMRELSVAAANGTQNSADLTSLNNEYQMMLAEIARIGANTEWNEKKLFDGEGFPGETEFQVGANVSQTIGVTIDKLVTSELGNVVGVSGFSTHSTTPPSAVTTQDSYTSHSESAPSVDTTAGVSASPGSDLDGDGDQDFLAWGQQGGIYKYINDGSGSFSGSFVVNHAANDSAALATADIDGDGDQDFLAMGQQGGIYKYLNDGSGSFSASFVVNHAANDAAALAASSASAAVASNASIGFSGLNLTTGDRVTITVPGGSNVSAVMDSSGLSTLLTSLGNSLAAQSSLFSGASNSGGTLTINGLADGSAMPSLSVTLEDGVDTSRFDFNNKNLVEGDQIVIKVTGGTDVQGTIDSNGLDTLLGTLATQLQSQSSLFSNASVSSGVLSLTGLSNGSAITGVTVEMNTASSPIGSTNISSRSATEIALGSVDKAIEEVSAMRAKYGAATNQLTYSIDNLTEVKINAESSLSRVKDADYATETSRLAANQIINEAATAMLAQANNSQELTMSLIKDWL
ncbi:flagellin [Luminiphilus sp.]|nr:flagellin [Luminiphilus sp.]MDA9721732.1 flagellin [Luminiphilus sp.]